MRTHDLENRSLRAPVLAGRKVVVLDAGPDVILPFEERILSRRLQLAGDRQAEIREILVRIDAAIHEAVESNARAQDRPRIERGHRVDDAAVVVPRRMAVLSGRGVPTVCVFLDAVPETPAPAAIDAEPVAEDVVHPD